MQSHKSNDCLLKYTSRSRVTSCIPIADEARMLDEQCSVQVALKADDSKQTTMYTSCTSQDTALQAAVHTIQALQAQKNYL